MSCNNNILNNYQSMKPVLQDALQRFDIDEYYIKNCDMKNSDGTCHQCQIKFNSDDMCPEVALHRALDCIKIIEQSMDILERMHPTIKNIVMAYIVND